MTNKTKGILITASIVITIIVLLTLSLQTLEETRQRKANNQFLPNLTFKSIDGSTINTQAIADKPTILVYFNSSCEYCIYEASQITQLINARPDIAVIFFSSEELPQIAIFAEERGLLRYDNVHFGQLSANEISRVFGHL